MGSLRQAHAGDVEALAHTGQPSIARLHPFAWAPDPACVHVCKSHLQAFSTMTEGSGLGLVDLRGIDRIQSDVAAVTRFRKKAGNHRMAHYHHIRP
ncbi:hypothetical protein D3C75_1133170 [compost metagenome]